MNVNSIDPSFGMAVRRNPRTPAVNTYIDKLMSESTRAKYNKIVAAEQDNPLDVYVSLHTQGNKCKFVAEAGGKIYKENFLYGPISTLKRAVKFSRAQYAEQKITKDFGHYSIDKY